LPSNLIVIFTERVEKSKDNNRGEDLSEDLEEFKNLMTSSTLLRSTSEPNYSKLARSASYSFGNVQVNDHHSDIKDT
jgi:hypothetical protein